MALGAERSGDGVIAILGAGAMGRLWAALLPSGCCGFLPRLDVAGTVAGASESVPEGAGELGGSFSRPGSLPETRCEYVLVRSGPPSLAGQGFGKTTRTASPDSVRAPQDSEATTRVNIARPWLDFSSKIRLLLVTTKAGDTLSALESWLPHIPENTPIVLFQNGLGSQQAVAERWPNRPVLAASTTEGANRPQADVLVHAGTGETWAGPLTACAGGYTGFVVDQLALSGLRVHAETSILPRLWQKLVVNAGINPFTAIMDCPNGQILNAPFFWQNIDGLCDEIAQLLQADTGQDFEPKALRERIEAVANSTVGNTSSMRADVNAGRKTEIDFINGYLVQCGKRHGIATPVNQMLVQRVQDL